MVLLRNYWAKCMVDVVDVPAKPEVDHGAVGGVGDVRLGTRQPAGTVFDGRHARIGVTGCPSPSYIKDCRC